MHMKTRLPVTVMMRSSNDSSRQLKPQRQSSGLGVDIAKMHLQVQPHCQNPGVELQCLPRALLVMPNIILKTTTY